MASPNNDNTPSITIQDVLKLAVCSICSLLKNDQRIIVPCGHSFCLEDLEAITKNDNATCPICQSVIQLPVEGVKSLSKDFHKNALVELAIKWKNAESSSKELCFECQEEATLWCQEEECGFCTKHAEAAHQFGKSKSHNLVAPSKKIVKVYCSKHKKEFEKYCNTCNTIICMDCFVFDHTGHKIGVIDSVAADRKKTLLSDWNTTEGILIRRVTEEAKVYEENCNAVTQNIDEVKTKTAAYFDEMLKLLQQQKEDVLNAIQQKEYQHKEVGARSKQTQQSIAEIKMQTQALSVMSQKLTAAQWLDLEKTLKQDFNRWTQQAPLQVDTLEVTLPDLKPHIAAAKMVVKSKKVSEAVPVKNEAQISKELDSKVAEAMNKRRVEQKQTQKK